MGLRHFWFIHYFVSYPVEFAHEPRGSDHIADNFVPVGAWMVHLCSSAAPDEPLPNFRALNLLPRSSQSFKVEDAPPIINVHRLSPGKFSPASC